MAQKRKSFVGTLIALLIAVVLLCGIGVLIFYRNKGTSNFYVQYGETSFTYESSNVELPKNEYLFFYCKGDFVSKSKLEDFKVSVIPADNSQDFDFSVDGQTYPFSSEHDLTSGFNIKLYDGYFTLYLPKDLTMKKVLQAVYSDYTVTNVPDINVYEKDIFSLVVYSERSNASVTIGFH